jgi:hypothetical protein
VAQITLAGRALFDVGVIIPRALYTNNNMNSPGVNNFAIVDSATNIITGSDIKGAHDFIPNVANWGPTNNVHDGSLVEQSFTGSTVSGASVNTILLFNNDPSIAGDLIFNSKLVTRVPGVDKLVVGELVRGSGIPDGTYITAIDVANNTITLSQAATQGGSATTLYAFDKASVSSGDIITGGNSIANISDPRLQVGMTINGPGIPAGTTITSVEFGHPDRDGGAVLL